MIENPNLSAPFSHSPAGHSPASNLPAGYERRADGQTREAELMRRNEALQEAVEALQVAQEDLMLMRLAVEGERQRYQQLFEFATDGYLVTDINGVLREANNAGLARLNITYQHMQGKILSNYVDFDSRIRFRAFLQRIALTDARLEWEGRITPRHGPPVDVVLTACRMPDAGGHQYELRWLLRDVTERKRLEQARQMDQQQLLEQERRAGVLAERNRIAQEFHDTLAQGFTGIAFLLGAAENTLNEDPEQALKQIRRARQVAQDSIGEARRSIRDLRTQTLEDGSLSLALAELLNRVQADTGIETEYTVCGTSAQLSAQVENDLLRIAQESVTNCLKHAHATRIALELKFASGQVQMRVIDNGQGFSPAAARAPVGFGLIGMRERASRIGGDVVFQSDAQTGTKICVTVPLPPPPPR